MGYRIMGRAHALAVTLRDDARGQGTVEYVGLILLIAMLIAGVLVAAKDLHGGKLAETITDRLRDAIQNVGKTDR